jgi:hypothetical protein
MQCIWIVSPLPEQVDQMQTLIGGGDRRGGSDRDSGGGNGKDGGSNRDCGGSA